MKGVLESELESSVDVAVAADVCDFDFDSDSGESADSREISNSEISRGSV
jgi:hypothetical protein